MGAWEAASHGAAQYGHGRVQVVPGKGGRSSSGQGNVDSWEVRCKADPSRAGPGSSNVKEQREGEGNVLLAGSTGQLQWRKVAQGQVHKMPRLVFISSCRTIVRK